MREKLPVLRVSVELREPSPAAYEEQPRRTDVRTSAEQRQVRSVQSRTLIQNIQYLQF
jgi:hypothetical protein